MLAELSEDDATGGRGEVRGVVSGVLWGGVRARWGYWRDWGGERSDSSLDGHRRKQPILQGGVRVQLNLRYLQMLAIHAFGAC